MKTDTQASQGHHRAVVALSAIPNTGKSTLFNRLTGGHQSTGNWPGVSVEKKSGHFALGDFEVELVDLPGAYSLSPVTEEEKLVRDFFLNDPPDLVLNILDARNLYRGLGLTLQMAMSGLPLVVAVNMMDEARKAGLELDLDALARHLGVPVVPVSARTGEGIPQLLETLHETIGSPQPVRTPHISCPTAVEEAVKALAREFERSGSTSRLAPNFLAWRLLESPEQPPANMTPALAKLASRWKTRIESASGTPLPMLCAGCRFSAARGLAHEVTHERPPAPDEVTERLDAVFLHRWLGLPVFALIMILLFQAIYGLGTPLQSWLNGLFQQTAQWLGSHLGDPAAPGLLQRFLIDGLWQGVSVVLSFFPIIALFFLLMSLLEDSGYLARAAFLMDRLMHRLGLDGKAFISLLLGYGCNVPAVMGTRILSSRHNRILTMLLIPFSLCSARLQVFIFFASILFAPGVAPWVLVALYAGSFLTIIIMGITLNRLKLGGQPEPFIMEMPPYRMPTLRTIGLRTGQELKDFIYRAATLIVAGVVLVWLLSNLPLSATPGSAQSLAGQIGQALAPVFAPLGIPWQEVVALLSGFVAKEIVIGALAVIHGGGDLAATLSHQLTPLQGLSFMLFTLLYTPCVATLAAIRAESGSWKILFLSVVLGLSLAWLVSFAFYQSGRLLGLG